MSSELNDIMPKLRNILDKNDNVLLAYLFGSRARGKASPISDYDIAILLKDRSLHSLANILFSISEALKINEDKIDILDLAEAPLYIKARVLAQGVKIIDKGYEDSLRLEVNLKYPEIAHLNRKIIRAWLKNPNSIDIEVIKDRLDYITQLNKHLKTFLEKHSLKDLSNFETWHALKSMVQDSTQAIINICAHIFSSKNLGIAESYRQYIEELTKHGLMERNIAEKLKIAIAIRNRLIYRYLTVKPEELWDFTNKLTKHIIPKFREWTLKIMRET